MLKLTVLLLLIPAMLYAQKEELYLNDHNIISDQKSTYQCRKDYGLSKGYAMCFNAQNKLVKELNLNLHVPDSLKTEANKSFIFHDQKNGDYLIGDYKEGKRYNGFFKEDGARLDWMIYSFYKAGVQLEQLYNDQYNTVTDREDTQEAWTTLDSKNTFTNGILTNGITVMPVEMKGEGGSAELVHAIKGGQTVYFTLGLFAVNYGEFIKVTPTEQGYLVQSSQSRYQVRLTYNKNERKAEIINTNGKVEDVINYQLYNLDDIALADHKRSFIYVKKDDQLYIEQVKDSRQLVREDSRTQDNESSAYMNKIASNLYTKRALDKHFFISLLTDKPGGMPDYFGQYVYYEGKAYGSGYKRGTLPGTYSMDVLQQGKIVTDKQYTVRNKTLAEISAGFKRRK